MTPVMFAITVLLLALAIFAVSGVWLILSLASKNHAIADQVHINNQILVNRYNSQLAAAQAAERAERAREAKAKKSDKDNLFKFNPRNKDDDEKS